MRWLMGAIGVLALALFASNPTQGEYVSWLEHAVSADAAVAGNGFGGVMVSLLGVPLLDASTIRQDFFLFSIYETNLGNGHNIKVIGLLRHFVPLAASAPNFPHVVPAAAEGRWLPEDGYTWVINPPVAGDLRVRWNAGQRSVKNPHVVAASAEGRWLPETGYTWVMNPPVDRDFRVRSLSGN